MSIVRDIAKGLRETLLLSQRVETIGTQVASVAQTAREETRSMREDITHLRERVIRLETFIEVAKTLSPREAPVARPPALPDEKDDSEEH